MDLLTLQEIAMAKAEPNPTPEDTVVSVFIRGCSVNPDPLKSSESFMEKTNDDDKVVNSILRMQIFMTPQERLDFWKRIQYTYCRDCGRKCEPSGACPVCDK